MLGRRRKGVRVGMRDCGFGLLVLRRMVGDGMRGW
jgi:hypothetical protein